MSFFPRSFVSHDATPSSFHPLFRLLDDFDQYSRTNNSNTNKHYQRSVMKSFTPKFDVKEIGDVYELHGELPGIEQKDIEIEFVDASTLTIKGRSERSYTADTSPAAIEDATTTKAIDDASTHKEHQPTVEDENTEATANTVSSEVAKEEKPQEPEAKYWVSERSVGEFARSFTFPVRVDQEQVRASMKNGVLSVIVPKSKKVEARKIAIN